MEPLWVKYLPPYVLYSFSSCGTVVSQLEHLIEKIIKSQETRVFEKS